MPKPHRLQPYVSEFAKRSFDIIGAVQGLSADAICANEMENLVITPEFRVKVDQAKEAIKQLGEDAIAPALKKRMSEGRLPALVELVKHFDAD